jgi:hypothetical protein
MNGEKWSATAGISARDELDKDGRPKSNFSFRRTGLQELNLDNIHDDDDDVTTGLQIHTHPNSEFLKDISTCIGPVL